MIEKITPENCRKAYFHHSNFCFVLTLVSEGEMDAMRRDAETGLERRIEGYPAFYTSSGRLWPLPVEGIEVEYVR